jgi:hypothetical protein
MYLSHQCNHHLENQQFEPWYNRSYYKLYLRSIHFQLQCPSHTRKIHKECLYLGISWKVSKFYLWPIALDLWVLHTLSLCWCVYRQNTDQ